MRRLLPFLAVLALAACGGETPTDSGDDDGIGPGGDVASSVTVEEGADQDTIVDRRFPAEVVARATTDAGNPISGKRITFENRTRGGPSWEASGLTTNSQGRVRQTPTAGTVAWTSLVPDDSAHVVELVASNDGAPDVVQTFRLVQQPGPPVDDVCCLGIETTGSDTLTWSFEAGSSPLRDEHDNPVVFDLRFPHFAHRADSDFSDLELTIVADSAGCATVDVLVDGSVVDRGIIESQGRMEHTDDFTDSELRVDGTGLALSFADAPFEAANPQEHVLQPCTQGPVTP